MLAGLLYTEYSDLTKGDFKGPPLSNRTYLVFRRNTPARPIRPKPINATIEGSDTT